MKMIQGVEYLLCPALLSCIPTYAHAHTHSSYQICCMHTSRWNAWIAPKPICSFLKLSPHHQSPLLCLSIALSPQAQLSDWPKCRGIYAPEEVSRLFLLNFEYHIGFLQRNEAADGKPILWELHEMMPSLGATT